MKYSPTVLSQYLQKSKYLAKTILYFLQIYILKVLKQTRLELQQDQPFLELAGGLQD